MLAVGLTASRAVGPVAAVGGAAPASCQGTTLTAMLTHQGAAGNLVGTIHIMAVPDGECTLPGRPQLQIRDAQGTPVVASAPADATAGPTVTLSAGVGAEVSFQWRNWCGAPPMGPLTAVVLLPADQGEVDASAAGGTAEGSPLAGTPPCADPAQSLELRVAGSFKAAPGQMFRLPDNTAYFVGERFLAYWRTHGGLALNGYPISNEFDQQLEDDQTYTVQYFERVRLEYHPENPAPYNVLLGQFGRRIHGIDPAAAPLPDALYFTETGHNLRAGFRAFWEANGGLTQFGYPLSEEFEQQLEDGQTYTVQYFERARFEYHPENAETPYEVLLGQFGRRLLTGVVAGR